MFAFNGCLLKHTQIQDRNPDDYNWSFGVPLLFSSDAVRNLNPLLKEFFDEHERHLAESFHAFCVIL